MTLNGAIVSRCPSERPGLRASPRHAWAALAAAVLSVFAGGCAGSVTYYVRNRSPDPKPALIELRGPRQCFHAWTAPETHDLSGRATDETRRLEYSRAGAEVRLVIPARSVVGLGRVEASGKPFLFKSLSIRTRGTDVRLTEQNYLKVFRFSSRWANGGDINGVAELY